MRLLITGAASFVGAEFIRQCQKRGDAFVGIDVVAANPDTIAVDIRNRNLAASIPDGIDAVIHLAAMSRHSDCQDDPAECYDVNVVGTINVFQAARARGARQFIFASSEWVYDSFDSRFAKSEEDVIDWRRLRSDYALSKLAAESALYVRHLETGMPVTVLRFGIIYGPRRMNWSAAESLLAAVADGAPIRVGSRATARCFIYVADIARSILAAVGRSGYEVINVQGDAPVTLGEIVDCSARLLGRNPTVIETDPAMPNVRNVSNAKAKALLGWQPQVSLSDGLRSVVDFLDLERRD